MSRADDCAGAGPVQVALRPQSSAASRRQSSAVIRAMAPL
jgi:hypothetical protein